MATETKTETTVVGVDSKKMLKELADKSVKIKRNQRLKVEIVKATKHYKLGQVVTPHVTFANELIKLGIAKKVG